MTKWIHSQGVHCHSPTPLQKIKFNPLSLAPDVVVIGSERKRVWWMAILVWDFILWLLIIWKACWLALIAKNCTQWLQILPKAITELWYAAFKEIPQKLGTARTKLIYCIHQTLFPPDSILFIYLMLYSTSAEGL